MSARNEDTTITFDGSASSDNVGIIAYTWTFTDETLRTLAGEKPAYMFNTSGVFIITLNVADTAGNWATDTVVITVLDITKPTANGGQDQTVNVDETVNFDASASTHNVGITSYEWNFGDGATGTGRTATHTYTSPRNYTVTLTVKDATGNTATDTAIITVRSPEAGHTPTGEPIPLWVIGTIIAASGAAVFLPLLLWKRRKRKYTYDGKP